VVGHVGWLGDPNLIRVRLHMLQRPAQMFKAEWLTGDEAA